MPQREPMPAAPSVCAICRYYQYCRERVQRGETVACEPGNEYYEYCKVPRNAYRPWTLHLSTAAAD